MAAKYWITLNPKREVTLAYLETRRRRLVGGSGASGDKGGSGFKVMHKKLSIMLDEWVQRNFLSSGKNLKRDQWPPFKAGGRWIKGKGLDRSAKLLLHTRALSLSHLPFASKKQAGIGSDIPYSKHHEEGIGVPMRRTLPKHEDIKFLMDKLIQDHVAWGIR